MSDPEASTAENLASEETSLVASGDGGQDCSCRWSRRAWFPVKTLVAMALSQLALGSILLLGWVQRLVQRGILKRWWQLSPLRESGVSFADFAAGGTHSREHISWPNFVLGQNGYPRAALERVNGFFSRAGILLKHLVRSLFRNLRLGLQAILTTWTLTLPGCVLWLFAWYDGWNNSFNKGYEQAAVGPLVFGLGMILFSLAMFYVPLAQARFASTGSWRSFYEFRLVWRLIRQEWLGCLLLAGLYALASLPLNIIKTIPQFFPQMRPEWELLSQEDAIGLLKVYFFWTMLLLLPIYLTLRMVAGRIYASGVVRALRRGTILEEELTENEWEPLQRLGLLESPEPARHHIIVRALAWMATRAGMMTSSLLIFGFWLAFVFLIMMSEFFQFHPFVGWMNQPFVHLPWFRYLP